MSNTPRTDAAEHEAINGLGRCVGVNFARQLETELRTATDLLREAKSFLKAASVEYPQAGSLERRIFDFLATQPTAPSTDTSPNRNKQHES